MPALKTDTLDEIFKLTVDQRIELAQQLWQTVAGQPELVPVPEWHLQLIRERLAAHRADPTAGSTWEEVEARLRNRNKK